MKLIKFLIITLAPSLLAGCFALSTPISTAGLREQHINVMEQLNQKEHPGIIFVYESGFDTDMKNHGSVGFPYASIQRSPENELIGTMQADEQFKGAIRHHGNQSIRLNIAGKDSNFVLASEGQLELRRRYRTRRGYALQSLQLIAIPLDLALTAVGAVAAVALSPAYLVAAFKK